MGWLTVEVRFEVERKETVAGMQLALWLVNFWTVEKVL